MDIRDNDSRMQMSERLLEQGMDLLPIPGNFQLLEKSLPDVKMRSLIGGSGNTETDFAVSLQQSREAIAGGKSVGKEDDGTPADRMNLSGSDKRKSAGIKAIEDKDDKIKTNVSAGRHSKDSDSIQSGSELKKEGIGSQTSMAKKSNNDPVETAMAEGLTMMVEIPQNMTLFLSTEPVDLSSGSSVHSQSMIVENESPSILAGNDDLKAGSQAGQLSVDTHDILSTPLTDEPENALSMESVGGLSDLEMEFVGSRAVSGKNNGSATSSQALATSGISFPAVNVGQNNGQQSGEVVSPEFLTSGGRSNPASVSSEVVNLSVGATSVDASGQQLIVSGDNQSSDSPVVATRLASGMQLDSGSLNQSNRAKMTDASASSIVLDPQKPSTTIPLDGESAGRHLAGQKGQQVPVHATIEQHSAPGDEKVLFPKVIEQAEVNVSQGRQQFVAVAQGMEYLPSGGAEKSLPVTSNDILNQVTMQVPDRHGSRQAVTIQLQPESLGKVEVKLVMEHQKLTAHFIVQHSEVRDVLLKHVTSLHDALSAKGIDVKQVAVEIAPAEKTAGMAVSVDQHSTGGSQTGSFQQFAGGEGQSRHAFATRDQSPVQLIEAEKVTSPTGLTKSEFLQPGSLHIRA